MKVAITLTTLLPTASVQVWAEDLGNLSANPFDVDSRANPFGKGSPFAPNGINNPFSPYGSPFSNRSATNPFATDAPRLYDQQGDYRGRLSANPFEPDSTSNPFGRYDSRFPAIRLPTHSVRAAGSSSIHRIVHTVRAGGLKDSKLDDCAVGSPLHSMQP